MLFLKFSNANVSFDEGTLTWKICITNKTVFTTKQVQIINKKNFVITILNTNSKTFMMYVAI